MAARKPRSLDPAAVRYGPDGLVAAVVQDADDGRVLMVAWQDAEAVEATLASGEAHFHSRSRDALWKKGETSGNTLALQSIDRDCDGDALLVQALPAGPACHEGTATCFDRASRPHLGSVVARLAGIIDQRRGADPSTSYTARLLADGDLAARKVLEEAGEVAFAAKDVVAGGDARRVAEEAADLLYHLLVLIEGSGVGTDDVADVLVERMAT
jgi:phosphoribosyl-ATP pyrophosphohydrolase/phosphoribosyl-AMP cyclohydrolase